MPEEQTTVTSTEAPEDINIADLADAYQGAEGDQTGSSNQPEFQSGPVPDVWDTGHPEAGQRQTTSDDVSETSDEPEIPDGSTMFPGNKSQIDSWNGLRDRYKTQKEEFATLQKEFEELKSAGGTANNEEVEKLKTELQSFEALRRIRDSEAWNAQVMAPQIQALNEAKEIGNEAGIEESAIEDLFNSKTIYDGEQRLRSLGDETAEALLRPLVQSAIKARKEGEAAMKSADPVSELKEWEARSQRLHFQNQQNLTAQETEMGKAALQQVWDEDLSKSVIGATDAGKTILNQINQEIENGDPLDLPRITRALYWEKAAQVQEKLLLHQANQIKALQADIRKLGGRAPNTRPQTPSPNGSGGGAPIAGGLPAGTAWDS